MTDRLMFFEISSTFTLKPNNSASNLTSLSNTVNHGYREDTYKEFTLTVK